MRTEREVAHGCPPLCALLHTRRRRRANPILAVVATTDPRQATTHDNGLRAPRRKHLGTVLRVYLMPVAILAVAVPLTVSAVYVAVQRVDRPFPGFLAMPNGVIPTVGTSQWPEDKEHLFHGWVVAADGEPLAGGADIDATVLARSLGESITWTVEKAGERRNVRLPVDRFRIADLLQTYGILLVFGCANLVIGLIVGFLQPRTTQSRVFLLHTAVAGFYPITAVFLHRPDFPLLAQLCLAAECFVSATFIHLAMTFPVRRDFGRAGQRLFLLVPYGASAVLYALVLAGFSASPPVVAPLRAAYLYTAACLVFFLGMLAFAYVENRDGRVRIRIKAVLPGAILAVTVQFFVFVNNAFAGGTIPVQFGLLTPIPYYISLAYAIAKHDLFDVDRVVRQSFVYACVSVIVVGGYALVLQIPRLLFPTIAESQTIIGILFVILVAFAFDPLRQGVQQLVDRAFYRKRLDYRATLSELSEILTTLLDPREVVAQVTRVVAEALQLESVTVGLADASESTVWQRREDQPLAPRPEPGLAAIIAAMASRPAEFRVETLLARRRRSIPDDARETLRSALARLEAQVLLPLTFRGHTNGILALGPKRSGQPLDSEAIDLLRTLANQTAIALQNARSYQALQELNRNLDSKVRHQTEALRASNSELSRAYDELKSAQSQLIQAEKMASLGQLVAGVAHELNTPASFVHGGLANLEEYLARIMKVLAAYEDAPISDAERRAHIAALRDDVRLDYLRREAPELLRVCFEGSARINRIVEDLRLFARADSGSRQSIDVRTGIEGALRLLGAQIHQAHIRIERDYGEVPALRADEAQLNRVWINLLANAIDATAGAGEPRVRISTRLVGDERSGAVEVVVDDNGSGIDSAVRSRIFEPFFSTKPIGKGTGLGLSIVYGAVKSHGGDIEIDRAEPTGTRVTVRLPITAAPDVGDTATAQSPSQARDEMRGPARSTA